MKWRNNLKVCYKTPEGKYEVREDNGVVIEAEGVMELFDKADTYAADSLKFGEELVECIIVKSGRIFQ